MCLLFWQVCNNKLASKHNLLLRGVVFSDNGSCQMCLGEVETTEHIFLHCPISWKLWNEMMQTEGLSWVMPSSLSTLAREWNSLAIASDKQIWSLIPYALVWSIWMERNQVIFKGKSFSSLDVWDMHTMRLWCG